MKNVGIRLLIAVIGIFLGAHALAQTIRVGSVTDTRFGDTWTLDGSQMTNTRAKLLNPANFGVGGTVSRPIQITDTAGTVGSVTTALLAQFDVFFIGYLHDSSANAFTAAELTAMQTYVTGGGTMIVTCDDSSFDAVCAFFGHPATSGSPGINPIVPTAAGTASAIFTGPFGAVTAINEAGTRGAFTVTAGATVLAVDSTPVTPLSVVMIQNIGAGRVVFMADVDLIANGASPGATITSQNDRFLGNLFAFVPSLAVGPVATTTSLTSSLNPSVSGNAVTFTATTSGSGPTGTVQFFDGATNIGSVSLSGGMATLTITALAVGTHPISAVYGGDANNLGSTSNTVNQVVSAIAPPSRSTPIPAVDGWGLALIAIALLAAGIDALRRHKPRL